MEREFFSRLEEWKNDPQRRPLILEGPRGVGKTWLLRKLAEQFDAQVCLDFEQKTNSPLRYFPQAKNPVRMAQDLAAALCGTRGRKLVPGKSLLILDEPHMCPQALRALEHFSRELDIHVAAALSRPAMPSDRRGGMVPALGDPEFLNSLDFLGTPLRIQQIVVMQVPPLSFDEYLRISGDGWMADFMGRQDSFRPLPMELFISLTSRFREFLCTGGMPEAAQKTASLGLRRMEAPASVRHVRDRLIRRWKEDMLQGFRPRDREVIAAAWEAVGSRLRQKNKLFALSDIRRGTAKARLSALHWLVALGMIRLIPCTGSDPAEPLFKACYAGTAPLCQPYGGWTNEEMLPTGLCGLLNGALAENWLSRALAGRTGRMPACRLRPGSRLEAQFVVPAEGALLPAVIGTGDRSGAEACAGLLRQGGFDGLAGIVFTDGNLGLKNNVLRIPLFMAEHAVRLAGIAVREARAGSSGGAAFTQPRQEEEDPSLPDTAAQDAGAQRRLLNALGEAVAREKAAKSPKPVRKRRERLPAADDPRKAVPAAAPEKPGESRKRPGGMTVEQQDEPLKKAREAAAAPERAEEPRPEEPRRPGGGRPEDPGLPAADDPRRAVPGTGPAQDDGEEDTPEGEALSRDIDDRLVAWMNDPGRKPLVLEGPLGVGKSWLLKNLASRQQQFHESVVLDFAENLEYLEKLFPQEVDPRTTPLKVVEGLRWATGGKLLPGHTLLIFDEPQLCPRALLTMTYFSPRMGFHVAAACSRPAASFDLPGGKAPAVDVPATMKKADILYSARRTGRAAFMEVHPLSFSEYLRSLGDGRLADAMAAQGLFGPMPGEIFGPLSEKFREYLCTGGMPAAVAAGRHARALARTDPSVSIADTLYDANYCQIVDWIATSWQGFGEDDGKLFMDVWRAVLTQLEQRDRVFDPEDHADYCCGSAEAVRAALNWLSTLGTIRLVPRCSTIRPGCLPFRVYLADTGPLNVIHKLSPSDVESAPGLCGLRGGVFAENLVLQALERALDSTTRTAVKYWSAFGYYEVQFLIPVGDAAIPAAIEKGDGSGAKSLGRYLKRHMGARNIPGILFTDGNLAMEGRVLHLPLFMAEHAVRLAEAALRKVRAESRPPRQSGQRANRQPEEQLKDLENSLNACADAIAAAGFGKNALPMADLVVKARAISSKSPSLLPPLEDLLRAAALAVTDASAAHSPDDAQALAVLLNDCADALVLASRDVLKRNRRERLRLIYLLRDVVPNETDWPDMLCSVRRNTKLEKVLKSGARTARSDISDGYWQKMLYILKKRKVTLEAMLRAAARAVAAQIRARSTERSAARPGKLPTEPAEAPKRSVGRPGKQAAEPAEAPKRSAGRPGKQAAEPAEAPKRPAARPGKLPTEPAEAPKRPAGRPGKQAAEPAEAPKRSARLLAEPAKTPKRPAARSRKQTPVQAPGREIFSRLEKWRSNPRPWPLVLLGPRGSGKTWLLSELGSQVEEYVRLDFEKDRDACEQLFPEPGSPESTPQEILNRLAGRIGRKLPRGRTLIVFDEAQRCPRALLSLPLFSPLQGIHVACACSGPVLPSDIWGGTPLSLEDPKTLRGGHIPDLVPSRRSNCLELRPQSFSEYLGICGDGRLADSMAGHGTLSPLPEEVFSALSARFREFLCTGGMPAVVHALKRARADGAEAAEEAVRKAREAVLQAWMEDSVRGFGDGDSQVIRAVWKAAAERLCRQDKVFSLEDVGCGSLHARTSALSWLAELGMIRAVARSSRVPDYSRSRVYLANTGLLGCLLGVEPGEILHAAGLCGLAGGALAANWVPQALSGEPRLKMTWWRHAYAANAVPFVISVPGARIPAAIENGDGSGTSSIAHFYQLQQTPRAGLGIVFTDGNLGLKNNVLRIPLFMAEHALRLAGIAAGGKSS